MEPRLNPLFFKALIIHKRFLNFFCGSHDRLLVKPVPLSHVVLLDKDPLLRIFDKPENVAFDEDAERMEGGLKGLISIF